MHAFLSAEWFAEVDKLVVAAGDLQIPEAMRAAEINVTITTPQGEIQVPVEQDMSSA